MRSLTILAALLFCGCDQLTESHDWGSVVSVAAGAAIVEAGNTPLPDNPNPQPGDICANCNGRGKVGDGVVMTTCIPCKGTGRVLPVKVNFNPTAGDDFEIAKSNPVAYPPPQSEIRWQKWTLADGSITWGPCRDCDAYGSFREAVVMPAIESAEVKRNSFKQESSDNCEDGSCPTTEIDSPPTDFRRRFFGWRR